MRSRPTAARLDVVASMDAIEPVARVLEDGGIAAISWGHPRRAIYALLARADDRCATLRLNSVKGRPLGPDDAVGGIARARGLSGVRLVDGLFRTGPVALMPDA